MIAYAKHQFTLTKQAGGASLADHYAALERATGRKIEPPKFPSELRYLWNAFIDLHSARGSSGFGPNPIAWSEIDAYVRLTRWDIAVWEVEVIRELDNVFFEVTAKADEVIGAPDG